MILMVCNKQDLLHSLEQDDLHLNLWDVEGIGNRARWT